MTPACRIDRPVDVAHDGDMNETLPPPTTPAPDVADGDDRADGPVADAPTTSRASTPREFVRPRDGRRIGGVCAAIADRNGWSRTSVRLVAAFSVLLPGPQVLAYLIAWVVMPSENELSTAS